MFTITKESAIIVKETANTSARYEI